MTYPIAFAVVSLGMTWFLHFLVPIVGLYVVISMMKHYTSEV